VSACDAKAKARWINPAFRERLIEARGGSAMAEQSYDTLDGVIWYDGKLVPWSDANLHVLSHGLHYASAVFEGERAYGGEIFKCTAHSERLKRSAQILDFEIP
jgi:branched-chain amino acid aminotransferase